MKVGHDDEAKAGDDETPKFNAAIRGDAGGHILGNLAVKKHDGAASGEDQEAYEDPTERKIPIHM